MQASNIWSEPGLYICFDALILQPLYISSSEIKQHAAYEGDKLQKLVEAKDDTTITFF